MCRLRIFVFQKYLVVSGENMGTDYIKSLDAILKNDFTEQNLINLEKRIDTGFEQFNRKLGGGLYGGLTVLGAIPALGKTTFAIQLACNIAEKSEMPVLYFSQEVPAARIAAKIISRNLYQNRKSNSGADAENCLLNENQLMNCANLHLWEKQKKEFEDRTSNLFVVDKVCSAREIADTVHDFVQSRKENGKSFVPFVIVDYLQILPPSKDIANLSNKLTVERNLNIMLELAHSDGVPVFLISSLNRANYEGPIKMAAFKETGGIEYSADVLLGLQSSFTESETEQNDDGKRRVEIVVLKNRYGKAGEIIKFNLITEFSCFEETENTEKTDLISGKSKAKVSPENNVAVTEKEVIEDIEPKSGKSVSASYINNTKIANEIRTGKAKTDCINNCVVSARNQGEEIVTSYTITKPLSRFDCDVADAIYSIYKRGGAELSLRSILHELSGDYSQTLNQSFKDEIENSINKLVSAEIKIDCTGEMRERNVITENEIKIFSGKFLDIIPSDKKQGHYYFKPRTPLRKFMPLYGYGEAATQMIRFPSSLLYLNKAVSDTKENITIKRFLIQRFEIIRNDNNNFKMKNMKKIKCNVSVDKTGGESVCSYCGVNISSNDYQSVSAWKNKYRTVQKNVVKILNCYRKSGYIDYFSADDTGCAVGSIYDPFEI